VGGVETIGWTASPSNWGYFVSRVIDGLRYSDGTTWEYVGAVRTRCLDGKIRDRPADLIEIMEEFWLGGCGPGAFFSVWDCRLGEHPNGFMKPLSAVTRPGDVLQRGKMMIAPRMVYWPGANASDIRRIVWAVLASHPGFELWCFSVTEGQGNPGGDSADDREHWPRGEFRVRMNGFTREPFRTQLKPLDHPRGRRALSPVTKYQWETFAVGEVRRFAVRQSILWNSWRAWCRARGYYDRNIVTRTEDGGAIVIVQRTR